LRGTTIEIFNHSFLPRFIDSGSVVVDIGAHRGDFAHAVIQRFGCRVVSAEPVKELYDSIPHDPLHEVLNVAVGGKNQTISMNVFQARCASVLGPVTSGEQAATQTVEMVTLAELCRRAGVDQIDLLKMDIEGAEVDLFEACSDEQLRAVKQITVEFHEFLYPEQAEPVARVLERMRRLGFWVLPFSLDNTNVLFVNRTTGTGPVEVAFLRTFVRYSKGFLRRMRRMLESRDAS
jgi:FkbM family methyltransferase